jgi:hypothetical protein
LLSHPSALWFCSLGIILHLLLKLYCLHFSCRLIFGCFPSPVVVYDVLTVLIAPIQVGFVLLCGLILQEFLDASLFKLFSIKSFLNFQLIHLHFPVSSFSFFACKLIIVFGFFNFVHGSSIGEVLDLTRRNSFLFFLSSNGILDRNTLFNT